MRPGRALLLAAIRGYKRHVSPHKGFSCAYRVHLGACSCSTLGLRAISRYGAWRGLGVLRLRLEQCHLVAEDARERRFVARAAQAGFCECGDLPCDASYGEAPSCDACSLEGSACSSIGGPDDCDGDCGGSDDWRDCRHWLRSRGQAAAPLRRRRRGDPVNGEPAPPAPLDEPPPEA